MDELIERQNFFTEDTPGHWFQTERLVFLNNRMKALRPR